MEIYEKINEIIQQAKEEGAYKENFDAFEQEVYDQGFHDYTGCIQSFTPKVNKTLGGIYNSYRFAKLKYLEVIKHR